MHGFVIAGVVIRLITSILYPVGGFWRVHDIILSYHLTHASEIYRVFPSISSGFCKFLTGIGSYCCGKLPYDQLVISRASWYSLSNLMQVHILIFIVTTCYRVDWMCMYVRHWIRGRRHLLQMSCSWLDACNGVVVTNTVWLQAVDLSFYCELDSNYTRVS